jgi:predicted N-acyltransferase
MNPGWLSFDDYLAAFRSKRRNQIKRERRELERQGVEVSVYEGDGIPDGLVEHMFRLYKSTVDKLYWGRQYLNLELFELVHRRWRQRLCFIVARQNGELVAGTFNVRKGRVLYGRYWGTLQELRFLHFNVCYYAAIDYCVRQGMERFEPGAGGEFKYLRGFDARPTESMHFLSDQRLALAVDRYLEEERSAVADQITWLDEERPLKR